MFLISQSAFYDTFTLTGGAGAQLRNVFSTNNIRRDQKSTHQNASHCLNSLLECIQKLIQKEAQRQHMLNLNIFPAFERPFTYTIVYIHPEMKVDF